MKSLLGVSPVCLLAFLPFAAHAQTAVQISDIDPGLPGIAASSSPRSLTALAGKIIFSAEEPSSGRELWASDGTPAGTEMLFDICPGACSSDPAVLGTLEQRLLLFADSSERLWRTDGTRAGTFALGARAFRLAFVQGSAYFPQCGEEYCQLFRTDGTVAGTRSIAGLWRKVPDQDVQGPFVTGRKLFWFVKSPAWPTPEFELWTSDGTGNGTTRVFGFWPLSTAPRLAAAAGGRLFFLATDPAAGEELWTSDGTAAGTRVLTRFTLPRPFEANVVLKTGAAGVYFAADDGAHGVDVWSSDGTPAGTRRVTALGPDQPFLPSLDPAWIEEVGGRLLVIAGDAISGYGVFASSGASPSSVSLGLAVSPYAGLLRIGGRVLFRADDGAHGYELWSTNGTKAGTSMVLDVCPGPCDSQLSRPRALGTGAVFLASDRVHGPQIWTSDGTAAGTRPRTNLPPGVLSLTGPEVAALGERLFFPALDSHGEELWTSGPDTGGDRRVTDVAVTGSSSKPRNLIPLGDRLLFTACDGRSRELWVTDGTPEGFLRLTDFQVPESCDDTRYYQPWSLESGGGTTAFFWRLEGNQDWRLWRTDGTLREAPAGTREIAAFGDDAARGLLVHAGTAFFFVSPFHGESEVWRSDGTAAGTRKLLDLPADPESGSRWMAWFGQSLYLGLPQGLFRSDGTTADLVSVSTAMHPSGSPTQADGVLYFFAWRDEDGEGLWRTDGTPGGTRLVSAFPQPSSDFRMTELGGKLYLLRETYDGTHHVELWRSDGTAVGTLRLAEIASEAGDGSAGGLVVAAGRLFFTVSDGVHGSELWTSDGTAGGTVLVRDLYPGSASSAPSGLTAFGGRLLFAASDGVHGRELWESDGSSANTRLVQDIAPGGLSSSPDPFAVAGNRLYFSADDGVSGRELWIIPSLGTGCRPAIDRLCLGGGRFAVTVTWRDFSGNQGTGRTIPLTADTGGFWFFSPENLELAIKVLDGRALNGAFWVFYGALSNVEYVITVTDTQTGLTRRYVNPAGQLASLGDTRGFGPLGAFSVQPPVPEKAVHKRAAEAAVCTPGPERLCLQRGRFAVEATWKDFAGHSGRGTAVPLTADTGSFWFFDANNLEVFTKLLDGQGVNGKFWFFYGALSNVEYTLTVTDTVTGAVRTYHNPAGRFASVGDTGAF